MTHTAPPATRPAWYDAKLVDYLPFARKCANRICGKDDADEIVQDFYVDACNRWDVYDTSYSFGTFVSQLVRNAAQNRKIYRTRKMRSGGTLSLDDSQDSGMENWLKTPATQHDHAELSEVLRRLSGTRDSEALMRRAMGEDLDEIGADMGISRERVRQLAERERARLRKAVR
jgi:RNA polymerase sigma factor (sigma-70 family)